MADSSDRPEPKRIVDPRELKALAHPLRMRLIMELTTKGSSRVVDLAKAVDEPANSVSFHLRQLARYGLITRDTDRGTDGRERWWRIVSEHGFQADLSELRKLPGGPQAVGSMERLTVGTAHATLSAALHHQDSPEGPTAWFTDFGLHLSRAEMDRFEQELLELISRWMERSRASGATTDPAERTTYLGFVYGAPIDDVLGDGEDTSTTTE